MTIRLSSVSNTEAEPVDATDPVAGPVRPIGTSPSTRVHIVRVGTLALGGLIAVLTFLLVVGVMVPWIPYVGTAGSFVVPPFVLWFVITPLLAIGLTFTSSRLGLRRSGFLFTSLALLAAVGASVVAARQLRFASDNGVSVNLLSALHIGGGASTPDETASYAFRRGEKLKVDVYLPRSVRRSGASPILLRVHGAGWTGGSRADDSETLRWFANQGYVVMSIDYSLATKTRATWDVAQADVACALAWAVQNARRFNAEAGSISLLGESAGGNLAINTAYDAARGTAESSCGGKVPTVRSVATTYPGVNPAEIYNNSNEIFGSYARSSVRSYLGGTPSEYPQRTAAVTSITYINPAAPPTLIILPDRDHLVPVNGAGEFAAKARAAGIDVRLVHVPWADHGFDMMFHSIGSQATRKITRDFLNTHQRPFPGSTTR